MTTNLYRHKLCIAACATAAFLLAGCGGSGTDSKSDTTAPVTPVAWNVAVPNTALSSEQQAALDSGLALLKSGDYNGAISAITRLRSGVPGINVDVEAGLGLSYAARANMNLTAYKAAAIAQNFSNGTRTISITPSDAALYKLTDYVPGYANDFAIQDGNVALQMLVPFNTPVTSLPEARQAEIGMIATVQFLRVITNIMGGNTKLVTEAAITSKVQANYDASARASLNVSAKLLTATNDALAKQGLDGLVVSLPMGLTSILADGDITPAELAGLLKQYRS